MKGRVYGTRNVTEYTIFYKDKEKIRILSKIEACNWCKENNISKLLIEGDSSYWKDKKRKRKSKAQNSIKNYVVKTKMIKKSSEGYNK